MCRPPLGRSESVGAPCGSSHIRDPALKTAQLAAASSTRRTIHRLHAAHGIQTVRTMLKVRTVQFGKGREAGACKGPTSATFLSKCKPVVADNGVHYARASVSHQVS